MDELRGAINALIAQAKAAGLSAADIAEALRVSATELEAEPEAGPDAVDEDVDEEKID